MSIKAPRCAAWHDNLIRSPAFHSTASSMWSKRLAARGSLRLSVA
jgi:hypothetical protein